MRWRAITREAWRNVVSGTSRAGIVAVVLVTAAVGLLLTDLFAVRGIVDRVDEFRSGGAPLGVQSAVAGGGRPESTLPHGRFPSPPGPSRPNMPRQRPPEPR